MRAHIDQCSSRFVAHVRRSASARIGPSGMLLNLVSAQHFLLGRLLDANESGPIQRSFLRRFAID
jgi:hypothetical protein